ncbi:T9SS type A sorting domain-containing protein [Sunxiuqinia sp. A32]|uniref:T9SS type A sorting domain-containing protein n=1 Tax=Sunxiuqinia sp. A32 TaxID=3461496 RepID=UPI00404611B8
MNGILKIFPCPVRNYLSIENAESNNSYTIIDIMGNLIHQGKIGRSLRIDCTSLNPGYYTIMLEKNDCYLTNRFIKI